MLKQPKITDEEYIDLIENREEMSVFLKERTEENVVENEEKCYVCNVILNSRYNEEEKVS